MQCPVCDDRMREVERLGVWIDLRTAAHRRCRDGANLSQPRLSARARWGITQDPVSLDPESQDLADPDVAVVLP